MQEGATEGGRPLPAQPEVKINARPILRDSHFDGKKFVIPRLTQKNVGDKTKPRLENLDEIEKKTAEDKLTFSYKDTVNAAVDLTEKGKYELDTTGRFDALSEEIAKISKEKGWEQIVVTAQGAGTGASEASAIANLAFFKYISVHSGDENITDETLLQNAYEHSLKVVKTYQESNPLDNSKPLPQADLAVALVQKDGKILTLESGKAMVKVEGKDTAPITKDINLQGKKVKIGTYDAANGVSLVLGNIEDDGKNLESKGHESIELKIEKKEEPVEAGASDVVLEAIKQVTDTGDTRAALESVAGVVQNGEKTLLTEDSIKAQIENIGKESIKNATSVFTALLTDEETSGLIQTEAIKLVETTGISLDDAKKLVAAGKLKSYLESPDSQTKDAISTEIKDALKKIGQHDDLTLSAAAEFIYEKQKFDLAKNPNGINIQELEAQTGGRAAFSERAFVQNKVDPVSSAHDEPVVLPLTTPVTSKEGDNVPPSKGTEGEMSEKELYNLIADLIREGKNPEWLFKLAALKMSGNAGVVVIGNNSWAVGGDIKGNKNNIGGKPSIQGEMTTESPVVIGPAHPQAETPPQHVEDAVVETTKPIQRVETAPVETSSETPLPAPGLKPENLTTKPKDNEDEKPGSAPPPIEPVEEIEPVVEPPPKPVIQKNINIGTSGSRYDETEALLQLASDVSAYQLDELKHKRQSRKGIKKVANLFTRGREIAQKSPLEDQYKLQTLATIKKFKTIIEHEYGLEGSGVASILTADEVRQMLDLAKEKHKKGFHPIRGLMAGFGLARNVNQHQSVQDLSTWLKSPEGNDVGLKIAKRTLDNKDRIARTTAMTAGGGSYGTDSVGIETNVHGGNIRDKMENQVYLKDYMKKGYGDVEKKIKEIIKKYAEHGQWKKEDDQVKSEAKMLKEYQDIFDKDILPNITDKKYRDEIKNSIERSVNLISTARYIREHWSEYSAPQQDQNGNMQTEFDNVNLNLTWNKEEWNGAKGRMEGPVSVTEWMARVLAKRTVTIHKKENPGAVRLATTALALAKNAGAFTGAYMAGGAFLSGKLAGRTSLRALSATVSPIGAIFGVSVAAGVREGGLSWRGMGVGGKFLRDMRDVSYKNAVSRNIGDGKRREEIRQTLVEAKSATGFTKDIVNLINKPDLDDAERKILVANIAEVQARMNLTDMSAKRGLLKLSIPQNYLQFSEDNQQAEYAKLKGAVIRGKEKLIGKPEYDSLQQVTSLIQAQFRIGTQTEKLVGVIKADLKKQKISDSEAKKQAQEAVSKLMDQYNLDLGIGGENSLKNKMNAVYSMNRKAAMGAAVKTGLFGLAATYGAPALWQEGTTFIKDIVDSKSPVDGIGHYIGRWARAINGDIMPNDNLSITQQAVRSLGHTFVDHPVDILGSPGLHEVEINGIRVQLPNGLAYNVDQHQIMDIHNGQVFLNLANRELHVDPTTNKISIISTMKSGGVADLTFEQTSVAEANKKLIEYTEMVDVKASTPPASSSPSSALPSEVVLSETTAKYVDGHVPYIDDPKIAVKADPHFGQPNERFIPGHKTLVPADTQWEARDDGKFYLRMTNKFNADGSHIFLIKDAHFSPEGQLIVDQANVDPALRISNIPNEIKVDVTPATATALHTELILNKDGTLAKDSLWEKNTTEITQRKWCAADRNKFYDFKNEKGNLVLDTRSIRTIDGRGEKGVYFSLPNHAQKGIFIPTKNGLLELNPNSTEVIPNSKGMTLGQATKLIVNQDALKTFTNASEGPPYNNGRLPVRRDIFNLGLGSKVGYIEAAALDHATGKLTVGSTILGSHAVPATITQAVIDTSANGPKLTVTKTFQNDIELRPGAEIRVGISTLDSAGRAVGIVDSVARNVNSLVKPILRLREPDIPENTEIVPLVLPLRRSLEAAGSGGKGSEATPDIMTPIGPPTAPAATAIPPLAQTPSVPNQTKNDTKYNSIPPNEALDLAQVEITKIKADTVRNLDAKIVALQELQREFFDSNTTTLNTRSRGKIIGQKMEEMLRDAYKTLGIPPPTTYTPPQQPPAQTPTGVNSNTTSILPRPTSPVSVTQEFMNSMADLGLIPEENLQKLDTASGTILKEEYLKDRDLWLMAGRGNNLNEFNHFRRLHGIVEVNEEYFQKIRAGDKKTQIPYILEMADKSIDIIIDKEVTRINQLEGNSDSLRTIYRKYFDSKESPSADSSLVMEPELARSIEEVASRNLAELIKIDLNRLTSNGQNTEAVKKWNNIAITTFDYFVKGTTNKLVANLRITSDFNDFKKLVKDDLPDIIPIEEIFKSENSGYMNILFQKRYSIDGNKLNTEDDLKRRKNELNDKKMEAKQIIRAWEYEAQLSEAAISAPPRPKPLSPEPPPAVAPKETLGQNAAEFTLEFKNPEVKTLFGEIKVSKADYATFRKEYRSQIEEIINDPATVYEYHLTAKLCELFKLPLDAFMDLKDDLKQSKSDKIALKNYIDTICNVSFINVQSNRLTKDVMPKKGQQLSQTIEGLRKQTEQKVSELYQPKNDPEMENNADIERGKLDRRILKKALGFSQKQLNEHTDTIKDVFNNLDRHYNPNRYAQPRSENERLEMEKDLKQSIKKVQEEVGVSIDIHKLADQIGVLKEEIKDFTVWAQPEIWSGVFSLDVRDCIDDDLKQLKPNITPYILSEWTNTTIRNALLAQQLNLTKWDNELDNEEAQNTITPPKTEATAKFEIPLEKQNETYEMFRKNIPYGVKILRPDGSIEGNINGKGDSTYTKDILKQLETSKTVALGDLHASHEKLVETLVLSKLVTMPPEVATQYQKLTAELKALINTDSLFLKAESQIHARDIYNKLKSDVISKMTWVGGDREMVLIGDALADRGELDGIISSIVEHLDPEGKKIITIASNHDHASLWGYLKGKPTINPETSFIRAKNVLPEDELKKIYSGYLQRSRLMHYDKDGQILYTHAPLRPANMQEMIDLLALHNVALKSYRYEDYDAEKLTDLTNKVNTLVQQFYADAINNRMLSESIDNLLNEGDTGLLWNRTLLADDFINSLRKGYPFEDKGVKTYVHGHDSDSKNSDNAIGKHMDTQGVMLPTDRSPTNFTRPYGIANIDNNVRKNRTDSIDWQNSSNEYSPIFVAGKVAPN